MIDKDNLYYRARMEAANRDPLFSSRERAAAALHISPEALTDYESNRYNAARPKCDIVQRMVETYNAPMLKSEHIRAVCPLLSGYGGESADITQAALGWTLAFNGVHDVALRFAAIAQDGKITPDEQAAARAIREVALGMKRVLEDTILTLDSAMIAQKGSSRD